MVYYIYQCDTGAFKITDTKTADEIGFEKDYMGNYKCPICGDGIDAGRLIITKQYGESK